MGSVSRWISTKIDDYVMGVIEKRAGYRVEVVFYGQPGDDSPPLPDDKVYDGAKDGSGRFVAVGSLMISQGAKSGEKIIYSRDSDGVVKSKIYLNESGEVVLNGGTDFAVAFEDLKAGFDAFVSTFNLHTHPTAGTGPPSTPTVPSSDTIDASKVPTVRVP